MNSLNAMLVAAASALVPGGAAVNAVRGLVVEPSSAGALVTIVGSLPATFTVFKLTDPLRLVVDLPGADISAVAAPAEGKGPVLGVAAQQFANDRLSVGRVTVALEEGAQYDVAARGNDVVVQVRGAGLSPEAAPASVRTAVAPASAGEIAAPTPASPQGQTSFGPSGAPAPSAAVEPAAARPVAATPPTSDVVKRTVDERAVRRAARALNRVRFARSGTEARVTLVTDAEVPKFEVLELADPPRVAVDLYGVQSTPAKISVSSRVPLVKDARVGKHDDKVRLVIDLAATPGAVSAHRTAAGLWLRIAPKAAAAAVAARPALPWVKDVAFEGGGDGGVVSIALSAVVSYEVTRPNPRTRILTLRGVALPKTLERSLDTTAFAGPVRMVSSFAPPGESETARVVATLDRDVQDEVAVTPLGLHWTLVVPEKAMPAEAVIDGKPVPLTTEAAAAAPKAGAFAAEAPRYAASGAPQKSQYTGRRVSFEFKDIDIHNLLRIIAEVSKKNMVVADDVGGRVTIRLRNVPWDQALDLILRTKGLDKEVMGNIIRVAPLKALEEERKLRLEARKAAEKVEPLKVRIMPVNYARAGEIADKVKSVLTERGEVQVDQRTNVIIAKDTVEALARAELLIRNLDTPTPQVLIEARIVEASARFNQELGVQWGGGVSFLPATGNPTGLAFPSNVLVRGGSSNDVTLGTADVPNWAVNLPAATGTGAGGALGFVFGSAGGAVALNLRLSAMEAQGHVKTISAPKVTTLDNNDATISQGISIPFSQVSAAGVNTAFVEAKLELKVTPHVTADGSVLMKIQASNNQPDPALTGANGQPAISKKEAKTEVMVKDGDTTVIGGIYTRVASTSSASVPLLGRIPVLGWLFKQRTERDTRTELLIFITPHIVNRAQAIAGDSGA